MCERLVQKLAEADICYCAETRGQGDRYKWPMDQSRLRIYVLESDLERASKLMATVNAEFAEVPSAKFGLTDASRNGAAQTRQVYGEWGAQDRGVDIWSGSDAELADFLKESLRANELGYRAHPGSNTSQRIEVHDADVSRAREIAREVIEGTPPG